MQSFSKLCAGLWDDPGCHGAWNYVITCHQNPIPSGDQPKLLMSITCDRPDHGPAGIVLFGRIGGRFLQIGVGHEQFEAPLDIG